MSDENKYDMSDIINFASQQNPLEIKNAIDSLMISKVHAEIADKKIEVAKAMFGVGQDEVEMSADDTAEDDFEEDGEEFEEDDVVEVDDEEDFDLDISDDELEDLLNDLENLDDTDLDDNLEDDNLDSEENDNGENA